MFGQFGLTLDDKESDSLQKRLQEDLTSLRNTHKIAPDVVLVTGDITEYGKKSEFKQAKAFLDAIAKTLSLSRNRIVLIPGNHDVNRAASLAYFSDCESEECQPVSPYWPKLKHYTNFFQDFYHDCQQYQFSEKLPWTIYEIPEKSLVIAGLNSVMAESHLAQDHYGLVGEAQLNWFATKMKEYSTKGWYRIAIVHHNLNKEDVSDVEYLRDEQDLKRILGPHINLLFHGHTHRAQLHMLNQYVPILSTGSSGVTEQARPAEIPNQYQVIQAAASSITVYCRAYERTTRRWIGDNRISENGSDWHRDIKITDVMSGLGKNSQSSQPIYPYVHRFTDEGKANVALLSSSTPLFVFGETGIGKSTFVNHVIAKNREARSDSVNDIIVQIALSPEPINQKDSYNKFLADFVSQLDLGAGMNGTLSNEWSKDDGLAPWSRTRYALNSVLCKAKKGVLFLVLDRVENLLAFNEHGSFLSSLRGLLGNTREPWTRLRIIFESTIEKSKLKTNTSSIQEITKDFSLSRFTPEQVSDLARQMKLTCNDEQIRTWHTSAGGMPRRLHELMQAVVTKQAKP